MQAFGVWVREVSICLNAASEAFVYKGIVFMVFPSVFAAMLYL